MFCLHCGKEIQDNAKFCPFCGDVIDLTLDSEQAEMQNEEREKPCKTAENDSIDIAHEEPNTKEISVVIDSQ